MAKVRLTWKDRKLVEDGVNIYRGTAPIDPGALPAPLASVPVGREVYEDKTVTAGTTYHYHVAPFDGSEVGAGAADSVAAAEEVPRFLYCSQFKQQLTGVGNSYSHRVPDCKAGDLLVFFGFRRNGIVSGPTGWTDAGAPPNGTYDQWTYAFYKIADGSEAGTDITLTLNGDLYRSGAVAVFRHDTKPINVSVLSRTRHSGPPGNTPLSFTNGPQPALVMSIVSWAYQFGSGTENYIENHPATAIPICRPTRWWPDDTYPGAMRMMAWVTEAAANQSYNSGTSWTWGVSNASDARSDIYMAFWV